AGADALRPVDLQVRRSSAQRRRRRDPDSQVGHGELSVGGGAQFEFGGKRVSEERRSAAQGCIVDPVGSGPTAGAEVRPRPGQNDGGREVAKLSPPAIAGETQSAYG